MVKGTHSLHRLVNHETIVAGKYELRKWLPGKFWLSNGEGEGMETSEAKIEKMLDSFFKREF